MSPAGKAEIAYHVRGLVELGELRERYEQRIADMPNINPSRLERARGRAARALRGHVAEGASGTARAKAAGMIHTETDLTVRNTARELVAVFQQAEADTRAAFASLVAAEHRLHTYFGEPRIRIDATYRGSEDHFDDVERTIERMKRQAWACIVERLQLRAAMSIARAKELDEQLQKGELPPITEENVSRFAEDCYSKLPEMLIEAVAEVFEWLRPRNSKYKTNSELEIPGKVILGWVVDRWSSGYHVHHHRGQYLTSLENVFSALDGKGQINKTARGSALHVAIESAKDGRGETEYFRFRACDNHNLHVAFRRLDLLKKFNEIAGGKRMRPAAA